MGKRSVKRLDLAYREKLLSTDVNRAIQYGDAALLEILRYVFLTRSSLASEWNDGVWVDYSSRAAPMIGEVLGGLTLTPTAGSLNFQVSAGAIIAIDPTSQDAAEDSPLHYGVGGTENFVLTTNSSGSTRIDVVEVSIIEYVSETANVDVFDEDDGLFNPTLVDKVAYGRIQTRVRAGTPGGGVPAAVEGWLPIYLVSVPTGVTSDFHEGPCVFWDVRPLVHQRSRFGIQRGEYRTPGTETYLDDASIYTAVAGPQIQGYVRAVINGRYVDGSVASPYSSVLDLGTSTHYENGYTPGASQNYYLYLCVPMMAGSGSHPYAKGTSVILPQGAGFQDQAPADKIPPCRGLILASATAPDPDGTATISAPTWAGLGAMHGLLIGFGATNSASDPAPLNVAKRTLSRQNNTSGGSVAVISVTGAVNGSGHITLTLTQGTDFPSNATRVRGFLKYTLKTTGAASAGAATLGPVQDDSLAALAATPFHSLPLPESAGADTWILYSDFSFSRTPGSGNVTAVIYFSKNGASHVIEDTSPLPVFYITEVEV
jgi:hypothetical protein